MLVQKKDLTDLINKGLNQLWWFQRKLGYYTPLLTNLIALSKKTTVESLSSESYLPQDVVDTLDMLAQNKNYTDALATELKTVLSSKAPGNSFGATYTPNPNITPPATFWVEQTFFGMPTIAPSHYHLGVYTDVVLTEQGMQCTAKHDFVALAKPPEHVLREDRLERDYYYGCTELKNTYAWQNLPGISHGDEIAALRCVGDYSLQKCTITGTIQIKLTPIPGRDSLTIEFNTKSHLKIFTSYPADDDNNQEFFVNLQKNDLEPLKKLPPEVRCQILHDFFNDFAHQFPKEYKQPASVKQQWLDCLTYKVGACRHRATWFVEMAKRVGLPAELVVNTPHAFALVKLNDTWNRVDLGGSDCNIILKPVVRPWIGAFDVQMQQLTLHVNGLDSLERVTEKLRAAPVSLSVFSQRDVVTYLDTSATSSNSKMF